VLLLKGLIGGLVQVVAFGAMLLIPAGTWDWPRAVQFLIAYWVIVSACVIWLAVARPESLEARLQAPVSSAQPRADQIATILFIAVMTMWFVFLPLDVFRFQLLPAPSLSIAVIGAVLGLAGFAVVLVTIYQNSFAIPVVRDQSDAGQTLVDTGVYGIVRHPMYAGLLVMFIGMALWLESYAGAIAVVVVLASLVPRILVEEKTLRQTLPGYPEYQSRIRYRLLPGVC
jgi:protein-S-isoprenylcysteine O-methyltransferase Ste14